MGMENLNSNRKYVHKSAIDDALKSLDSSVKTLKNELMNTREVPKKEADTGFIEINKLDLNSHADTVISVLRNIKSLK